MADDLPIKITLDPGPAAQGAKTLVREVEKTEQAAAKTKTTFDSLTETFRRIADYERAMAREAAQVRLAVDNLASGFGGLGKAITASALNNTARQFDSLTQAIKREQEVLQSIHGPAQQHQQDLQILNKLYRDGKINAEEYARSAAKSAASAGSSPQGSGGQLSTIASGIGSLNLKQAAAGANQAFELLNQKLHITDDLFGSVVGSAVKFGATGAQIAGPWGAAVGVLVGVTADLAGKMFDAEAETRKMREEQEKLAKEYWEGVKAAEAKKRIEQELAPEMARHAEIAKEIAEREATVKSVMNGQADAYRKATDRAQAYGDQLDRVNSALSYKLRVEGYDPTKSTPQTEDETTATKAARGYRDAQLDANAATKGYGETLKSLEEAENKRNDRLQDLEQIMGDISVSESARKLAFKEYDSLVRDHDRFQTEASKAAEARAKARVEEIKKISNAYAKSVTDALIARLEAERQYQSQVTRNEVLGVVARPSGFMTDEQINASARGNSNRYPNDSLKKSTDEAKAFQATVDDLGKNSLASLQTMAQSVGDSLVDAFMTGEFSAKKFFDSLASMALKSTVSNLINFGFAQFDTKGGATGFDYLASSSARQLPGFATGGDMYTRGAGSTDSMLAMFKVTPGESIHVRTPEQRREAAKGSGGGGVKIVNQSQSRRSLLQDFGDDSEFDRVVLNVLHRNPGAVRSLG